MSQKSLVLKDFCISLFQGETLKAVGEIRPDERIVLMGPSGCGKSTFLRSLAGLHPRIQGELCLGSENLDLESPRQSRPGLVFQGGALFEHLSVFENAKIALDYNPEFSSYSFDLKAKLIAEYLTELKMPSFESRLCQSLSGGEKQRVALLRCLLSSPNYLLLDEPLSALDSQVRADIQQLILNLLAKKPRPTLIVTHDQSEAKVLGTRILQWPELGPNKTRTLLF